MSWRDIPDTELAEDKFLAASTLRDLRDNVPALAEGTLGAPRIQAAALATGTAERDWVLARTATASAGAVGTYAMLALRTDGASAEAGSTAPGSSLFWASSNTTPTGSSTSPAGTWRCMGLAATTIREDVTVYFGSVWLRIS